MANCHEMELGDIYVCENCGLELQVAKECKEFGTPHEQCECSPCTFVCCGEACTGAYSVVYWITSINVDNSITKYVDKARL